MEEVVGDEAKDAEQARRKNEVAEVRGEVKSLMLSLSSRSATVAKLRPKVKGLGLGLLVDQRLHRTSTHGRQSLPFLPFNI